MNRFKTFILAVIFAFSVLSPAFAATQQHVVTFGQNLNFSMDRLADAVAKVESTPCSIVLRYGTWYLDGNVSTNANTNFQIPPGAVLDGAYTLTINGPFSGSKGCFGPSLTVIFANGSVDEVYPKWFNETYASLTRTRASIAVSGIPIVFGKIAGDPDTTGWGSAETGSRWYNSTLGSWRWWDGSAVAAMEADHSLLGHLTVDDHPQYPSLIWRTGDSFDQVLVTGAASVGDLVATGPWIDSRAYASIALADAAAAAAGKPLYITQNYTLSENTVFASDVNFIGAGSLTKASTYTATFNGRFEGRMGCLIGFGPGDVIFGPGAVISLRPELWAPCKPDGTSECNDAIQSAAGTKIKTILAEGTYKATGGNWDVTGWDLQGQGWSMAGGTGTMIAFNSCGSNPAMYTRQATSGKKAVLKGFYMYANSWDPTTGCAGYGLDLEQAAAVEDVLVSAFGSTGIFFHNNAAGAGPYQSRLVNVKSIYNGGHGLLVGTGANALTIENYEGKWNGAPAYVTAPSVAGVYDGFHVERDNAGNPASAYYTYLPDGLLVLGGDCSYNAGYGWNFLQAGYSKFFPSYAEGNLHAAPGQVNLGSDLQYTRVEMGNVSGNEAGINMGATYAGYLGTNELYLGGKYLGAGNTNTAPYQSYSLLNKQAMFGSGPSGQVSYILGVSASGNIQIGLANGAQADISGGDLRFLTNAKGIILRNAAGTLIKRVRLNDTGDGLIYENE